MSRRVFELGAIAVAATLLVVMAYLFAQADGMLLASGQPLFGDFIAFWSAGRAALEGQAANVHDPALIAAYHQLAAPRVAYLAPWNSPPPFLIVAAALALLPYPAAALCFFALSGALYLYAARKLLPDARALIFAVTLPAAVYELGSVQTGLVIAGVSGLALYWLEKRPVRAGALVGLLAIKPHLAILWPLLLALSGRWRAFAAAAASTLAFAAAAGFLFGFDLYLRFFENLAASQQLVSEQRISTPAYASLYGNLLDLGAPQALAISVQAVSAIAAILFAARLFLRGAHDVQGAALCAATLLASPYLFYYDFTLLAVGAALLGTPRDRFELTALVLAWSAGLSLALGYIAPLPLCPIAAWAVLIAAMRRAGNAPPHSAPAPRT